MKEIIVDNFAGGGGASTGIEMATGRSVDIAINHDPNAIAMHTTNHPDTLHYCESVFDIDPIAATAGQPVGLAWFSPDCRHFSKAKGSKPVKKEIRGLAWIVVRWALSKKPRVVMLENVEEFKTWGPLITAEDGTEHPDPAHAGETFAAFVGMLTTGIDADHPALLECCEVLGFDINSIDAKRLQSGLGYVVDHKELRASDYGAPTIRKRFFMVMRCDGKPVVWPEPTHGDPKSLDVQSGHRAPWRTAAECIDWSIPCPSIFERKKPLAENTLKRIARGIQRFVIDNPTPFIVKCNHTSSKTTYDCFRGQALDQPLQTITKTHGYAVVTPHITKFRSGATGQECDEPLPTITAGSSIRPGGNGHALGMVEAKLTPFIARIGQTGFGGDRMVYEAGKPLTTITSKAEHLLVAPIIAREFGNSVGHAVDEPSGTITAGGGGKSRLVSAFLAKHFGGNYTGSGADLNQPAHTVTTVDHHALVTSNLIKMRGTNTGQKVTEPLQTVTAGGNHFGEVRAFLLKYYGNEKDGVSLGDPLHTVTTNDRFGLVTVEGIDYQIVDIGMRMLQPHELYAAQGFPTWYIIDRDYTGNKYAKDKQVARCGNAVPPPFADALVRANLPEMCVERKEVAA
ncbi:DNA cytosine methyltransferase [Yersinia kristensenii]|uniref:DNA cytosine methyltransferase n=1 Tax=Yersinia kristensenii TaxID=28152 RepID=UPI0002FFC1C4|nr:DNA cytosine methyltransferase [Yersinia kristensenii]PEH53436.1 DNA cytosine methyltransferase [Yersinia kristensenii]SUP67195.1 putative cytosine-specific modification methylase [Yersinia kristensenii]